MKPLNGAPVFRAGESQYYWEDVLLAAIRRGDWPTLERRAHEELAAIRWQMAVGVPVAPATIEASAAEFRYARGLVSADEMRAWLATWGLSAAEWMEWVRRDLARTMAADARDKIAMDYAPSPAELMLALPVTFVCSGIADRFAQELARHAAASALEHVNPEALEGWNGTTELGELLAPFGTLPADWLRARAVVVGCLDHALVPLRTAAVTPTALRRELDARHLDWVRVDYRSVVFASEHAAREAAWCVRGDGLDLAEVAARAGATVRADRCYLCDVDGELRAAFLGARAGELIGPTRQNGCFALHQIDLKQLPSLQDPEMRRRAEDDVLQKALAAAVQDRIQWQVAI